MEEYSLCTLTLRQEESTLETHHGQDEVTAHKEPVFGLGTGGQEQAVSKTHTYMRARRK